MKRVSSIALAVLFLLLPLFAWGQSIVKTGTITTASSVVGVQALNKGSGTVQVTGTWSATLRLQCKVGTGSLTTIPLLPIAGGAAVTSFTANGMWLFFGAFDYCEVNASAFTSGTAIVNELVTNAHVPPTLASVGAVGGSGTAGVLAKWTAGTTLGNSIATESGTTLTVANTVSAATVIGTATITTASVAFAALGTPAVGNVVYCNNCDTPAAGIMATCTSAAGQAGAWAFRTNTAVPVWGCIGL